MSLRPHLKRMHMIFLTKISWWKLRKKSGKTLRKSGKSQGKMREFDGMKKVGTLYRPFVSGPVPGPMQREWAITREFGACHLRTFVLWPSLGKADNDRRRHSCYYVLFNWNFTSVDQMSNLTHLTKLGNFCGFHIATELFCQKLRWEFQLFILWISAIYEKNVSKTAGDVKNTYSVVLKIFPSTTVVSPLLGNHSRNHKQIPKRSVRLPRIVSWTQKHYYYYWYLFLHILPLQ